MRDAQKRCAKMLTYFLIGVGASHCAFQVFLTLAIPFVEVGPLKTLIDVLPGLLAVSIVGGLFALLCYLLQLHGQQNAGLQGAILLLGSTAFALAAGQCLLWPRGRNDATVLLLAGSGLIVGVLLAVVRAKK